MGQQSSGDVVLLLLSLTHQACRCADATLTQPNHPKQVICCLGISNSTGSMLLQSSLGLMQAVLLHRTPLLRLQKRCR
jgi:hypothetical protein